MYTVLQKSKECLADLGRSGGSLIVPDFTISMHGRFGYFNVWPRSHSFVFVFYLLEFQRRNGMPRSTVDIERKDETKKERIT